MKFGNPDFIYLLLVLPIFIFLYVWFNRNAARRLDGFAKAELLAKLVKDKNRIKKGWKFTAFFFILTALVIALARPQFGVEPIKIKRVGIDIMVVLDTSLSMAAEDIAPNRLAKAKKEVGKLAEAFAGNRIGLIVFSGDSAVECPLTLDVSTFNLFLNSISFNSVPVGGTDISGAMRKAVETLSVSSAKSKVIVLITDGEDHEGDPVAEAKKAAKDGIKIFTVGFGSEKGVPIPIHDENNRLTGYKKDRQGNMVLTRQNSAALEQIALYTDAVFVQSNQGATDISPIIASIQKLEKSAITSTSFTSYVDRFQIFLGIALVLLFIEVLI